MPADVMTYDESGDSLLLSTLPSIEESPEKKLENHATKAVEEDDEEEEEKSLTLPADDSGLCTTFTDDSSFDNGKLLRACSCQSIADDATLACDSSQHGDHDDDADLDDYDTSENITSISLDEPNKSESSTAPVPLQANAHLYCHASNLQLDLDDSSIDQKTQK
jgi:pleckstrin homology domain-containing family G member 4